MSVTVGWIKDAHYGHNIKKRNRYNREFRTDLAEALDIREWRVVVSSISDDESTISFDLSVDTYTDALPLFNKLQLQINDQTSVLMTGFVSKDIDPTVPIHHSITSAPTESSAVGPNFDRVSLSCSPTCKLSVTVGIQISPEYRGLTASQQDRYKNDFIGDLEAALGIIATDVSVTSISDDESTISFDVSVDTYTEALTLLYNLQSQINDQTSILMGGHVSKDIDPIIPIQNSITM